MMSQEEREKEEKVAEEAQRKRKAAEDLERAQKADFVAKVETGLLRQTVKSIHVLVDECRVRVGSGGLDVAAVDPTHIAMIQLHLDRQAFESFMVEEPFDFMLDVEKLMKELGDVGDGFEHVEIGFRKGQFYLRAGNLTTRQKNLLKALEHISDPKVPRLNLPATFVVPRREVSAFMRLDPADWVRFIAKPDGLELWAESGASEEQADGEDVVLSWKKDELEVHECKEVVSSLYPLDHLHNIIKSCPAASFRMKMGQDYPIRVAWKIGKQESANDVHFLLAPRVDDDETWKGKRLGLGEYPKKEPEPGPDSLGISGTDDGGTP